MAKKKTFENIISNLLGEPVCNLCHAFYDQYVEANASFRARAGMKTVIIRRQLGRCCEWCAERSGIFDYDSIPDGVFQRHDYCKCLLTVRFENGNYIDAWSKKEFSNQREARLSREKELKQKIIIKSEIETLKRKAAARGEKCVETLSLRLKEKQTPSIVGEADFIKINGVKYKYDKDTVVFPTDYPNKKNRKNYMKTKKEELMKWEEERNTAKLLTETFGGPIELVPRVIKPEKIRTPDYIFRGMKCDRKAPIGGTSRTIKHNLYSAKGQADVVVLDITKCKLETETVVLDIKKAYGSGDIDFLKAVILIRDNKVIKVYEKI